MEINAEVNTHKPTSLAKTLGLSLIKYWIGSFNGIQVFVYPILLLNWLNANGLVNAVSHLLTLKIHYFPLSIFLFLLFYVLFILAKYYFSAPHTKAELKTFIIKFHKYLFISLLCFALLFLLAIFLKYFYGILISEKAIASWAARILGFLAILYCHLSHSWTEPWQKMGHSFSNAVVRVKVFARRKPYHFHLFNVLHLSIILIFSKAYMNWQEYIYHPLFHVLGLDLKIKLIYLNDTLALSINVILVCIATLCSSFFFIPLVWLAAQITRFLHPIKTTRKPKQSSYELTHD